MAKAPTIKPEEQFARSYADRLILAELTEIEAAIKLSELAERLTSAGLGLAEVRSLLASNPDVFRYHERRWVPAARLDGIGRPQAEAIRLLVERFGGPMPVRLIILEVAGATKKDSEVVEATVRRIAANDPFLILSENDTVSLVDWAFIGTYETPKVAYEYFGVNSDEVAEVSKKLAGHDWSASDAVAKALAVAAPVSAKALGAACWLAMNEGADLKETQYFDGRDFFGKVISVPGYVFGTGGMIHPEADAKKWLVLAAKVADKLAPTVDIEDAAPIEVKSADVSRMVDKVKGSDVSVTGTKLLEEFYEITPSNKTFPDDLDNLMSALKADSNVLWVGGDRFKKANAIPDFVESVPEPFQFVDGTLTDEEGELIDVELTDEGLSSSLRKLLLHPLAMDVLDEDIPPVPKTQPEQIRLVLKSIHRELGTFPMAQISSGWLDESPKIQELIFVDPQGRELQVWANHDARLLYNLIDWWYEQPVESGSVFTLTKTGKPNVFEFAWDEQTDPVVYISTQRMEDLRSLQERTEGMSTLEVLIEVMNHWPKGADFLTLLAEVNVARRTTRRLLASLLSSYQCFYQRSGSPVWHFDAKKIDLGFDKAKRKFVKK